jgi:hypothetical protein
MCDDCISLVEVESYLLSNLSTEGFLTVNEPQRTSLQYVETSGDVTMMKLGDSVLSKDGMDDMMIESKTGATSLDHCYRRKV